MKKSLTLLIFALLISGNIFPGEIDYHKLKFADEIFFQYERLKITGEDIKSDHYASKIRLESRILYILLDRYKKIYKKDFGQEWKYEEWIKTIPD